MNNTANKIGEKKLIQGPFHKANLILSFNLGKNFFSFHKSRLILSNGNVLKTN